VERLFSIVDIYWSHFPYLISNLSFDEERVSIELNDEIVCTIGFAKTNKLRMNQQTKSVVAASIHELIISGHREIYQISFLKHQQSRHMSKIAANASQS
jgi:hypothetical protein